VKYSRVFKLFLLVLLPLTLGWKLAVRPNDPGELRDKEAQLKVADFLAQRHFTVSVSDKVEDGQPTVRASAGACLLVVMKSPPFGWDRELIRRQAAPGDEVFVVFAGKTYAEQPTWLTVSDFLWSRFQRELGLKAAATPVFGVIAAKNCAAERLPWHELG
jgi:hypothetical protein